VQGGLGITLRRAVVQRAERATRRQPDVQERPFRRGVSLGEPSWGGPFDALL
jgi:hypothetical protein